MRFFRQSPEIRPWWEWSLRMKACKSSHYPVLSSCYHVSGEWSSGDFRPCCALALSCLCLPSNVAVALAVGADLIVVPSVVSSPHCSARPMLPRITGWTNPFSWPVLTSFQRCAPTFDQAMAREWIIIPSAMYDSSQKKWCRCLLFVHRGTNIYGVAVLIYDRLQKLWIYGQVKISTVKLG